MCGAPGIRWFLSGEKRLVFDMEAARKKKLAEREAKKLERKQKKQ
jgi:hypothetical protein